jgi:hypothetical protein
MKPANGSPRPLGARRALLARLSALAVSLVALSTVRRLGAESAPSLYAAASCAPAPKPGRVRCRGSLELPLADAARASIIWAELRIVSTSDGLQALRGRLALPDAETREPGRVAWSYSVAAKTAGEHRMELVLRATVARDGRELLIERPLTVVVRVDPG